MKSAVRNRTRIDRLDQGAWLYRLLADIQEEVASHPSPRAVERIRGRLVARIKLPDRVAA